ncbi:MAG: tetratricopeptide repeat protein [Cyanobacteria bacterium P01_D01_bin.116]
MAEETSSDSPKNINMEATARDESKVVQIGHASAEQFNLTAEQVNLVIEQIEPVLERLQQIGRAESPGVLKAGNPYKKLAHWQGRTEEITQLTQWLTDKNTTLIGIEGIGGTGKSMLAAKIYEEIEGFPKRFWADVSYGAIFTDLARQILTEFGYRVPEEESKLVEALVKCLQSGQYLLIVDNLESLLQPDRQWRSPFYENFFRAWVEYGNHSTVLVTTREHPELYGFKWLPLQGLKVAEGEALLRKSCIRGDLKAFVELVDGHPLLLRLVADLLDREYHQDLSLERLANLGLGNLQQLLTDPQVVGQHRRENVGMVLVLDASFERLSDLQKKLLLNASVSRGAFDSAAAAALIFGNSEVEIERELRKLVKRSLLLEKLNEKRQFEFQSVVLEYVRYKAGDQTEAHQRAIYYYLLNAKQKPWQTENDIKEYLEIFYHWYQLEKYDSAFDILRVCNEFLILRGYYSVQVEACGKLVAAWQKTGERENWKYRTSLTQLGNAYLRLGEYQRAIEFYRQHLQISEEIGDRLRKGQSLGNLGNAYLCLGEYQRAIEFYRLHLQISEEIGDREGEGSSLGNLGCAYEFLGNCRRAIKFHQQSLEIAREIGDRKIEGNSLGGLGNAYRSLGKYQWAIEFHHQHLNISREIGERWMERQSLGNLGDAYCSLGEYQQAIKFYRQSLEIAREIGDRRGEAMSWYNLAQALENVDRKPDAIGAYRNAYELSRLMEFDVDVNDCDRVIERLLQQNTPILPSRRGFCGWLNRLWQWINALFGH